MCKVVSRYEVGKVGAQLIVDVVMKAFDGRVLDRAVHPLDLAVGPRMVLFCQAVLDPIDLADHVEAHWPRIDGVAVPGLLCKLDATVRENGVNLVGHGSEHVLQELPRGLAIRFVYELGYVELTRAVDADKEIELSLHRLNFSNINVEEADGVALELMALRLVPVDFRQARDTMSLQAAMQTRLRQMWAAKSNMHASG